MTTDQAIGRKVHMVLWDRGIQQRDLCVALGISPPTLSRKLHGERPWTVDEVYGAAVFFHVKIDELLPDLDEWCAARDSNPEPADKSHTAVTSLDAWRRLRRASQLALAS